MLFKTLGLFACLMACINPNGYAQTGNPYYYYHASKYQLAFSDNHIVVGYKDGKGTNARRNILAGAAGIAADSVSQNRLKGRYLLKLKKTAGLKAMEPIVNRLKKDPAIAFVRSAIMTNAGKLVSYGDEFVVKLKAGKKAADLTAMATRYKCRMLRAYPFAPGIFILATGAANEFDALKMSNIFFETGLFEYAEPDFTLHDGYFDAPPSDPLYALQWAHKNTGSPEQYNGMPGTDMKIEEAWTITKGSEDIVIAVVDSGVDTSHIDLKDNLVQGFDCVKLSAGPGDGIPLGYNAHGTCCAGMIAAVADNGIGLAGIAPGCKIMPINVADWNDNWTSLANIAAGFDWAWQNGASIISNSWGGSLPTAVLEDAIRRASTLGRNGKGTMIFFAAGNNSGGLSYPAILPEVISVGGISMCGERKSLNSCDGEIWGANYGTGLDVVAPCVRNPATDIPGQFGYSTGDYYELFSGTSSACPNAAGVAALVLSANKELTAAAARMIIENNCDKNNAYPFSYTAGNPNGSWNSELGYGLVNAYSSILAAQSGNYCNVSIAATGYTTICEGGTTKIQVVDPIAGAAYQWKWNGSDIQVGKELTVSGAGRYEVEATYQDGCIAFSAPVNINVKKNTGALRADAGKPVFICPGGEGARIGGAPAAINGVRFVEDKRGYGIDLISRNFVRFNLSDPGNYDIVARDVLTEMEGYNEYYFTGGDFTPLGYYALARRGGMLVRIDTATGERSLVATIYPEAGEWSGLAWDPATKQLYATASYVSGSRLYKVNLETGSVVPGIVISQPDIKWITFNNEGSLYALSRNVLIRVDKETGGYYTFGNSLNLDIISYQGGSFDPYTDSLYMSAYWKPWNSVASQDFRLLDTLTGQSTVIGTNGTFQQIDALAIAGGNYQYNWSPATGLSNPADANPIANPATTTTYTLTVTDLCGNTATSDVQVIANAPKPPIRISAPKDSICLGESVRLAATSNDNYFYQWTANNKKIPGATDSFYVASRRGNYQVSVMNGRGGCVNTSSVFFVKDCSIRLADNSPDSTCYSYFYPRLGYRDSAFRPNENWVKTIYPAEAGSMVNISFSDFRMNSLFDTLFIYDGADEFAPVIGKFHYYQTPYFNTPYRSSAGPLTFRLLSSSSDNSVGTWDAFINCYTPHVFRSRRSGDFETPDTWETKNADNTYSIASDYPTHYDDSITINPGHTVAINRNLRLDQLWIKEGATLVCNNYIDIWKGRDFDMLSEGELQLSQWVGISGIGSVILKGNLNGNGNQMLAPFYVQGTTRQSIANNAGRFVSLHIENDAGVTLNGAMRCDSLSMNSKSSLVCDASLDVPAYLQLNRGIIQFPVNASLLLTPATIIEGGNSSSFVDGAVSHAIHSSYAGFTAKYPVGIGRLFRPLQLEIQRQSFREDNYKVQLFNQAPPPGKLPAGINAIASRYYKIEHDNNLAVSSATVTITYGKGDGVLSPDFLRIAKDDAAGNWIDLGGKGSAIDSGQISSTINFNSFGNFVLANATGGCNVLPLTWLDFSASLQAGDVQLRWSVSNEINVQNYLVEHSTDGSRFNVISTLDVQPGDAQQKNYHWVHGMPSTGDNYYRIRQVDKDGRFDYSSTEAVRVVKEVECTVSPNPSKDRVWVDCQSIIKSIHCYNTRGELVSQVSGSSRRQAISVKAFPSGLYILKVTTRENKVITVRLLKE